MKKSIILLACIALFFLFLSQESFVKSGEHKPVEFSHNLSTQEIPGEKRIKYPGGIELKLILVEDSVIITKLQNITHVPEALISKEDSIPVAEFTSSGPPYSTTSNSYPSSATVLFYFESVGSSGHFSPEILVEASPSPEEAVSYTVKFEVRQNTKYVLKVTYFFKSAAPWSRAGRYGSRFIVNWLYPSDTMQVFTSLPLGLPATGVERVNARLFEITSDMKIIPTGISESSLGFRD